MGIPLFQAHAKCKFHVFTMLHEAMHFQRTVLLVMEDFHSYVTLVLNISV